MEKFLKRNADFKFHVYPLHYNKLNYKDKHPYHNCIWMLINLDFQYLLSQGSVKKLSVTVTKYQINNFKEVRIVLLHITEALGYGCLALLPLGLLCGSTSWQGIHEKQDCSQHACQEAKWEKHPRVSIFPLRVCLWSPKFLPLNSTS